MSAELQNIPRDLEYLKTLQVHEHFKILYALGLLSTNEQRTAFANLPMGEGKATFVLNALLDSDGVSVKKTTKKAKGSKASEDPRQMTIPQTNEQGQNMLNVPQAGTPQQIPTPPAGQPQQQVYSPPQMPVGAPNMPPMPPQGYAVGQQMPQMGMPGAPAFGGPPQMPPQMGMPQQVQQAPVQQMPASYAAPMPYGAAVPPPTAAPQMPSFPGQAPPAMPGYAPQAAPAQAPQMPSFPQQSAQATESEDEQSETGHAAMSPEIAQELAKLAKSVELLSNVLKETVKVQKTQEATLEAIKSVVQTSLVGVAILSATVRNSKPEDIASMLSECNSGGYSKHFMQLVFPSTQGPQGNG